MDCLNIEDISTYFTKLDDMKLAGGYGIVYKASVTTKARSLLQLHLPDIVAVKQMHVISQTVRQIIQNEILILSSLTLRHSVKYYGCLSRGDEMYLIMEWAEGYELGEILNNDEFYLPQGLKQEIALELAIGIQEFHHAGIAHRDIKVDNVIFSLKNGALDGLKIIDYGYACTAGNCMEDLYTREYRDPWVISGNFESLLQADWYAYGVTLLLLYQQSFARCYNRRNTPAFIRVLLESAPRDRPSFTDMLTALIRRRSPRSTVSDCTNVHDSCVGCRGDRSDRVA